MFNRLKITIFISIFICIICTGLSQARWRPQYAQEDPTISKWYSEQKNSEGQYCCDKSDGHDYYDDYTINPDGSVTLADGHKINSSMVLKNGNPTGHAVYWYIDADNGSRIDYCFSPGSGS